MRPPGLAGAGGMAARMLAVSWDTVRLFLHVLAATIWVGGQITLAALVPALRRLGAEIPRAAARRFNQVAWPAFGVLVIAGVWNTTSSQRYLPHVRPPDASYPHETPCTVGQDSNPVEGAS